MRYVDIYQDDSRKEPIAFDSIQTGAVHLTRTPNVSRFTMADGSPCLYPAAKDTAALTLRLECTNRNAAAIARNARLGSFLIAGMSFGLNRRSVPGETAAHLPEQSGVTVHMTGGVQIEEISAAADMYSVTIPVQILLDASGNPASVSVPAVRIVSLLIDDRQEILNDAHYRYRPVGTFLRKQIIVTDFPEIPVSCLSSVPDGDALLTTIERGAETVLTGDSALDGILPLLPGRNEFLLTVRKVDGSNCKPQYVRFTVFRDDSTDGQCVLRLNDGSILTTGNGAMLTVKEGTE